MMNKKILRTERLRQVPAQFSWVDQRLVRDMGLLLCPVACGAREEIS